MHLLVRILTLSSLFLGACKDAAVGPEAAVVLGDWEWMAACCSVAGAERTPATEDYTYVLQFSDKGTVEVIRDNELILTTRFTVTRSRPSPTADEITLVHYDTPLPHGPAIPSADQHMVIKLVNGTLILRNPHCADCYGDWTFLPRLS